MKQAITIILSSLLVFGIWSCSDHSDHDHDHDHGNEHADEQTNEEDHEHEEVSIGSATVGEWTVELAQSHGVVAAGEEGHLVVVLPFNDQGATTVRAWIGSADRTLSYVGKGEYAASHNDYDVHATAPDPLDKNALWWIEIERPDGTKATGSAEPLR